MYCFVCFSRPKHFNPFLISIASRIYESLRIPQAQIIICQFSLCVVCYLCGVTRNCNLLRVDNLSFVFVYTFVYLLNLRSKWNSQNSWFFYLFCFICLRGVNTELVLRLIGNVLNGNENNSESCASNLHTRLHSRKESKRKHLPGRSRSWAKT